MARTSTTKSTTNAKATSAKTEVAKAKVVDNEEKVANANTKENTETVKKVVKTEIELNDNDEIEVVSLVPNVSYKDSKTNDTYKWDETGHIEFMDFATIKNMWRNNKTYFKNLVLKPNDERVITKLGLTKTLESYEYLMDGSNYTKENIDEVCNKISKSDNGMKYSICNKVKDLVVNEDISDVSVIKALEKQLGLELLSFL